MTFYDEYFGTSRWNLTNLDSARSESYKNGEFFVKLALRLPFGICPDGGFEPEAAEQCEAREIRRNDRKPHAYSLFISPN